MIKIRINGEDTIVDERLTPEKLLEERKITKGSVWVNGNQLLKKDFERKTFQEGDQVKVLRIISGG
ncbi:MAG: sulfur carrier protein ThiS [Anaerovoracaceae bacterium]|jgi:thiamine biosynthesis protein ThiS